MNFGRREQPDIEARSADAATDEHWHARRCVAQTFAKTPTIVRGHHRRVESEERNLSAVSVAGKRKIDVANIYIFGIVGSVGYHKRKIIVVQSVSRARRLFASVEIVVRAHNKNIFIVARNGVDFVFDHSYAISAHLVVNQFGASLKIVVTHHRRGSKFWFARHYLLKKWRHIFAALLIVAAEEDEVGLKLAKHTAKCRESLLVEAAGVVSVGDESDAETIERLGNLRRGEVVAHAATNAVMKRAMVALQMNAFALNL